MLKYTNKIRINILGQSAEAWKKQHTATGKLLNFEILEDDDDYDT